MEHFITIGKGATGIGALIAMFSISSVTQWVQVATTAGAFVVVTFTAVSLFYDIAKKRWELKYEKEREREEEAQEGSKHG